jgi:hypothetical protein
VFCELVSIDEEARKYEIKWTYQNQTEQKSISFDTLKLRPLHFTKNLFFDDRKTDYAYLKISEEEKQLLNQNKFINHN